MTIMPVVIPDRAKIKQLMWDQGYSVKEFARRLQTVQASDDAWADVTPLSVGTLYDMRCRDKRVSFGAMRLIAAALGVELDEIIQSRPRERERPRAA